MTDVGKISRKPGTSPFPTKRKSSDPLQPEAGEVDFGEELKRFDEESTGIVHGSEKVDQATVRDDVRRKRLMKTTKKEQKKKEDQQSEEKPEEADHPGGKVDLEV